MSDVAALERNDVFARNGRNATRWEQKRGHIQKESEKRLCECIILVSVVVEWEKYLA